MFSLSKQDKLLWKLWETEEWNEIYILLCSEVLIKVSDKFSYLSFISVEAKILQKYDKTFSRWIIFQSCHFYAVFNSFLFEQINNALNHKKF
jgi:hypothetical protein